jgi:hypothetical protein
MSGGVQIKIDIDAKAALAHLDRIANMAKRAEVIQSAIADAMQPMIFAAKSIVQQPGKPGYNKRYWPRGSKKMLRDTIGQVSRIYQNRIVGVAGPLAPAGAHGHLVEFGHRIARGGTLVRQRVTPIKWRPGGPGRPPKHDFRRGSTPIAKKGITGGGQVVGNTRTFPFVAPAREQTLERSKAIMIAGLQQHIAKAIQDAGSVPNG